MTDLAALRRELDGIDDLLHDGLMRRAELVGQIGAQKRAAGVGRLRPGREAAILRRLLGRHQGALDPASIVRVWREIFAGSLALQGAFTLAVPDPGLVPVARAQFGVAASLHLAAAAAGLALVVSGAVDAALIDAEGADWGLLWDRPGLFVAALLPFGPNPAETRAAFLVMAHPPDPSGDDRTLIALAAPTESDRTKLGHAVVLAGEAGASQLFAYPGFATELPAGLACPARLIGAYAVPIA